MRLADDEENSIFKGRSLVPGEWGTLKIFSDVTINSDFL